MAPSENFNTVHLSLRNLIYQQNKIMTNFISFFNQNKLDIQEIKHFNGSFTGLLTQQNTLLEKIQLDNAKKLTNNSSNVCELFPFLPRKEQSSVETQGVTTPWKLGTHTIPLNYQTNEKEINEFQNCNVESLENKIYFNKNINKLIGECPADVFAPFPSTEEWLKNNELKNGVSQHEQNFGSLNSNLSFKEVDRNYMIKNSSYDIRQNNSNNKSLPLIFTADGNTYTKKEHNEHINENIKKTVNNLSETEKCANNNSQNICNDNIQQEIIKEYFEINNNNSKKTDISEINLINMLTGNKGFYNDKNSQFHVKQKPKCNLDSRITPKCVKNKNHPVFNYNASDDFATAILTGIDDENFNNHLINEVFKEPINISNKMVNSNITKCDEHNKENNKENEENEENNENIVSDINTPTQKLKRTWMKMKEMNSGECMGYTYITETSSNDSESNADSESNNVFRMSDKEFSDKIKTSSDSDTSKKSEQSKKSDHSEKNK